MAGHRARLTLTTTVHTSQQHTGRYIARTGHRDVPCQRLSPHQYRLGVSPFNDICLNRIHTSILVIDSPIVANISLYNDPMSAVPTTLNLHTGNGCVLSSTSSFYPAFDIAFVQQLDR